MRLFLSVVFLLLWLAPVAAQYGPAYRLAVSEAQYPWERGLLVRLEADEELCKKQYGTRWQTKCAAPIGQPGKPVRGIRLSPQAHGAWKWQDANTMHFIPANGSALKPDTVYSVDISQVFRPSFVKIRNDKIKCRTMPHSARLLEAAFLPDPSPAREHRLTAAFEFNFPVEKGRFAPVLELPSGAKAGTMDIVWNDARDRANISWPIYKLSSQQGQCSLKMPGFGRIFFRDGLLIYSGARDSASVFYQMLPGEKELFHISEARINQEDDAALNRINILELELSLYASAKDLLQELIVAELPQYNSTEAIRPFNWAESPVIAPDALAKARQLKIESLQPLDAKGTKFRFRLPASAEGHVLVSLGNGLVSTGGNKLAQPWNRVLAIPSQECRVGFLQPGNILGESSILGLFANNLDTIDWKITKVEKAFMGLLAQASTRPYAYPLDKLEGTGIGVAELGRTVSGALKLDAKVRNKAQFAELDLGGVLENAGMAASGLSLVQLKGIAAGKEVAQASRLILVTDIAAHVKKSPGGIHDCFVYALNGSGPTMDAEVTLIASSGLPLARQATDARGHVRLTCAGDEKPVAAVATIADNIAWLPLNDKSRQINNSDFNTAGRHTAQNGALAYVFSQRGIYTPGDAVYFGCLGRMGDFSLLPAGLPLYAEIRDPRGIKIWESLFNAGPDGIAEIKWQSSPDLLSGRYTLNIKTAKDGDVIGSAQTRLEQFQPETMRMKIAGPSSRGWIVSSALPSLQLSLRNLYGMPARAHKIRSRAKIMPAIFKFEGFEEYIFSDPSPLTGNGIEHGLPELFTDAEGLAAINIPLEWINKSSAMLTVASEGFDAAGGRGATAATTLLVSPFERILGYRNSGEATNLEFIKQDQPAEIEIIALDSALRQLDWEGLQVSLSRRSYVTNLIVDGNGGYRYDDVPFEATIKSWKDTVLGGGLKLSLETHQPGDFMLSIADQAGNLLLQLPYTVVGDRLYSAEAPSSGSKMHLRLDKKIYKAGEEIQAGFSLPYAAVGIICIEREGVRAFEWIKAHPGDNIARIRIPDSFEGRGYISATFARLPGSGSPYMSPLAHTVMPFMANIGSRDMGLSLSLPKNALPGQDVTCRVSTVSPGRVIAYAVDEGILQVTAYQDPAPLVGLLGERALEVSTLQSADLLMPRYGQIRQIISAFGGGMDAPFAARYKNPFKRKNEPPVAIWAGILETGPDGTDFSFSIPEWYNGKIRVIVVGSGEESAGCISSALEVKGPLVLTPQLPQVIAPGDEFDASLILANTTSRAANIEISLDLPSSLSLDGTWNKQISLAPESETVVPFRLRADGSPGEATLLFKETASGLQRSCSLSIRPASAMRTTTLSGMAKETIRIPVDRKIFAEESRCVLLASSLPLPLAHSLSQYLETYPYGCTEQLVSRAFAQVLLHKWPLAGHDIDKRARIITAANNAIRSRFNGNGVSLWPMGTPDLLLTIYAADYLLSLRDSGLGHADDLLSELCDTLNWQLYLDKPDMESARICAYGIWILAREGRIVTQMIENLVQSLKDQGVAGWEKDLTYALLVAARREMRMPYVFDPASIEFYPAGWFDEYAQRSLLALIMGRYFGSDFSDRERDAYYEHASLAINNNGYSTFSACQGIRALTGLARAFAADPFKVGISCDQEEITQNILADGAFIQAESPVCRNWRIETAAGSPVYWQLTTSGYDRNPASDAEANGILIERSYFGADGQQANEFKQGDEINVRITAASVSSELKDCVISDLLPGGVEMLLKTEDSALPANVKYLDRKDDRLLVFADLSENPIEIEYKLKAVAPGRFAIPPVYAEAMYDRSLSGNGSGGNLVILKQ